MSFMRLFALCCFLLAPSLAPAAPLKGVALSGAEFGAQALPGQYGKDFTYPEAWELEHYRGLRMTAVRLPFAWERLQRWTYQDFDAAEAGRMDNFVKTAHAKGLSVILDPHNYARFYGKVVGQDGGASKVAFADLWRRLALRYKSNPWVVFGLMNEPHDMSTEVWVADAQAAIDAIRNVGADNLILVPGNQWTGAWSWTKDFYGTPNSQALLEITDPKDHFAFEVHQYLDGDSSGTSPYCVSTTVGVERLQELTAWLTTNHKQAFLGELAGGDNAVCREAVDRMLSHLDEHPDQYIGWTWWGGGPWWGNYMFSLEPGHSTEMVKTLEKHL